MDYNRMTVKDLRALAKDNGLKGYSRLKKSELISFIRDNLKLKPTKRKPLKPMTVKDLRALAKDNGLKGYSKLKKSELISFIRDNLKNPSKPRPPKPTRPPPPPPPYRIEQAFRGALRSFRIDGRRRVDADTFFISARSTINDLIIRELRDLKSAKIQTTAWIRFRTDDDGDANADGNFETVDMAFNSRMIEFFSGSDFKELIDQMLDQMKTQIENPALANSSFVFDQILHLDINFNQLNLTRGSSYIPLPKWISHKKAVINPRNEHDEKCFPWAVIAALHHEEIGPHPERISNLKPFENNYDWSGLKETEDFVGEDWKIKNWGKLEFPVAISSIGIFERNNDISVNVLAVKSEGEEEGTLMNEGEFYIVRKSKNDKPKVVDLLLLEDGKKRHYAAIKNMSRLIGSANSKNGHRQHFCRNCLQGFHSEESKNKHFEYCKDNEAVRIEMPKKDSFVKFHSGQNQFKVPFVIYADFEAILQNVESKEDKHLATWISHTRNINKHIPSGFCTHSKFAYGEVSNPTFQYRGEDCVEVFCDYVENEAKRLYHMFPKKPMDPLTREEKREFRKASQCHICLKPFEPWETKVRDHCHYTGKYRGAAHEKCNLQYAIPNHIPVILHNMSGYDSHLFIRELGKKFDSKSIDVIAKNTEKYISFEVSVVVDELEIPGSKEKIAQGETEIAEGERLLEEAKVKGQDKIDEGKKLIDEGKKLIAEEKKLEIAIKHLLKTKDVNTTEDIIEVANDGEYIIAEGKKLIAEGKRERSLANMRARKILNEGKKLVAEGNRKQQIKQKLRFIDSFRFMPSSLDALSKNLVGTNGIACSFCFNEATLTHIDHNYYAHVKCEKCNGATSRRKLEIDPIFNNLRTGNTDEQFRLLVRKGVYPYEYLDDWNKFDETKLPPIEKFYSKLNLSGISQEDYDHAQRVWKEFNIKTLGDYHDLYLKTDVLLLANVFETFRKTCLEHYQLDPAHFYTSPGLAWEACLKQTGINLELLTDPDMLLMFERGTRGGITQAVHRYASANNKYMGDSFDPSKPPKYVSYLDANNLYGHAMSQKLPNGGFKWVSEEYLHLFTKEFIHELVSSNNSGDSIDKGYLLEVDVTYPKELHDAHNDLPFLPEKMKLNGVEKLVTNLYDKVKYVVHIAALDQALQHGLILKKVHRVIEFNQSYWLNSYINFNTQLRTSAKNDFEKDFFKLMNNSVFGKTMENIRKHRDVKLITNKKAYLKNVMQPNFKSRSVFSENLVGCNMGKKRIVMNKPVYIGQAILDLSKIVMYEFHYDYMIPKYAGDGDSRNLKLCYMDTDSLVYEIQTEDFYKDIAVDVKDRFDTSNYPKSLNRPLPIGLNKKVIGLMKDEMGGKIITEFVALRPKLYAYKAQTSEFSELEDKKCKGIKKCVVKKTLSFEDYKKCLLETSSRVTYRKQMIFRNRLHEVHTVEVNKIALTRDDDKRIIQSDGISTRAHGHFCNT